MMFGLKKRDYVDEFVTGPSGEEVLRSMGELADHFKGLDGWHSEMLSVPELAYLAAFHAWVAIRDDRDRFSLTQRETAEVAYGLVQGLCRWYAGIKRMPPDAVQHLMNQGRDRLLEYDTMWTGGMEKNDLGAFCLHAFSCVQANVEKTQDGFVDHVATFHQTISRLERQLKATL